MTTATGPAEEARLARLVAAGDGGAEAELCKRIYPRVRAWARKHARGDGEASDLAQQVLVVALEAMRAGKLLDAERLSSFLFGTCKRTLMAWRGGDRRRRALLDTYGPSFAEQTLVPAPVTDRARLLACLEALGARDRAIVTLTFWADRDADEIGHDLQMTTTAVRVARHRALKQLHGCMEAPP